MYVLKVCSHRTSHSTVHKLTQPSTPFCRRCSRIGMWRSLAAKVLNQMIESIVTRDTPVAQCVAHFSADIRIVVRFPPLPLYVGCFI